MDMRSTVKYDYNVTPYKGDLVVLNKSTGKVVPIHLFCTRVVYDTHIDSETPVDVEIVPMVLFDGELVVGTDFGDDYVIADRNDIDETAEYTSSLEK